MKRFLLALVMVVFLTGKLDAQWFLAVSSQVEKDGKGLGGASVTLLQGGAVVKEVTTESNGEFTIEVPANGEFIIQVAYPECSLKKFYVSTRGVPADVVSDNFFPKFKIGGFTMKKPLPGIDYGALKNPLVKIIYFPQYGKFDHDPGHTEIILNALGQIRDAEKALIEKQSMAVKAGDAALKEKECELAKTNYEKAISLIPQPPYEDIPKTQLEKCKTCIAEKEDAAKKAEEEAAKKLADAKAAEAKAAADKLAKEKAEKDKLEADKLAKEKAETDRLAKEKADREKAEADRIAKEKAEKDKLEADKIVKEKVAADLLAKEKAVKEKSESDRLAKEKEETDRLLKEKQEKEKAETDRLANEKLQKEKTESDRIAKENAEKERLEKEKQGKDVAEKERVAKEQAVKEQAEKDRLAKIQADADKAAKEKVLADEKAKNEADKKALSEKQANEKAEADKLAKEKKENDRLAAEKAKADKLAQEKAEKENKLKEKEKAKEVADRLSMKETPKETKKEETVTPAPEAESNGLGATSSESGDKQRNIGSSKAKHSIPQALGTDKYKMIITRADDYFKMKRYQEAKEAYEEALTVRAADPHATSRLEQIQKLTAIK